MLASAASPEWQAVKLTFFAPCEYTLFLSLWVWVVTMVYVNLTEVYYEQ